MMDHYQRFFEFIDGALNDPEFFPLLSDQDQADIVAFLKPL